MINKIKNWKILRSSSAAGIYVYMSADSVIEYSLVLLQKQKSRLNVKHAQVGFATVEGLSKAIPKNTPVYLAIDGKGIIHKKVNIAEDIDEKTALNHVLPNAEFDDFIVNINSVSDDKSFVSLARKENIVGLLTELFEAEINVLGISLGCFSINNIFDLIKNPTHEICFNNFKIEIREGAIFSIEKSDNTTNYYTFRVGDENIEQNVLISFSVAFSHFIGSTLNDYSIPLLQTRQENYLYKKFFVMAGWSILSFLFATLLVNFLLFDYYNKKNDELSLKVNQNKDLLSRLDTLSSQIKQKEAFINKSGFLNPSRTSFYADRIAYLLFDETTLTNIEINPLQKKLKQDIEPIFTSDVISVEGITKRSNVLNDWMHILKKETWISEVNLINYINESGSSSAVFKLEIKIKR